MKEGSPLKVVDGVLYYEEERDGTSYSFLLAYPSGKEGASYTIPDRTLGITGYAFAHCKNLSELVIPQTVHLIKNQAFRDTGLTEITVSSRCDLPDDLGIENLTVNYYP